MQYIERDHRQRIGLDQTRITKIPLLRQAGHCGTTLVRVTLVRMTLVRMTLIRMTLSRMTLVRMTHGRMTLGK